MTLLDKMLYPSSEIACDNLFPWNQSIKKKLTKKVLDFPTMLDMLTIKLQTHVKHVSHIVPQRLQKNIKKKNLVLVILKEF